MRARRFALDKGVYAPDIADVHEVFELIAITAIPSPEGAGR